MKSCSCLVKQGHKEAFEDMYRRFWQELLDAAYRRVKVQETAMELVQSLLVNLYLKRETISLTQFASQLPAYLTEK